MRAVRHGPSCQRRPPGRCPERRVGFGLPVTRGFVAFQVMTPPKVQRSLVSRGLTWLGFKLDRGVVDSELPLEYGACLLEER